MAKLNVTVDNGLEDLKLESHEKLETKKRKKVDPKKEVKKEKTNKKGSYLSQVGKEMKLVTWPTRKNVIKYSVATIIMVVLLAMFFIGLSALFDLLYGLVQGWIG